MTNGVGARHSSALNKMIYQGKKNSLSASKILGFKWLINYCGDFSDNGMDKVKLLEVVKIIEKAKKKIRPHIIYTHHPYDLNVDHRIVTQATLTAFRPQANEIWVKNFSF